MLCLKQKYISLEINSAQKALWHIQLEANKWLDIPIIKKTTFSIF